MNTGDSVLLFYDLPYDFEEDLPFNVLPALEIVETPFDVLDSVSDEHLACFVLPGYKLIGMPISNCCLISPDLEKPPNDISRNDLFFLFVTALRLIAPAQINISGKFEYGGEEDSIRNPCLYNIRSTWQPSHNYKYCNQDFLHAKKILIPIINCMNGNLGRFKYAFTLFSQVTSGFSHSYQMNVLSLFAVLEALFVQLW